MKAVTTAEKSPAWNGQFRTWLAHVLVLYTYKDEEYIYSVICVVHEIFVIMFSSLCVIGPYGRLVPAALATMRKIRWWRGVILVTENV